MNSAFQLDKGTIAAIATSSGKSGIGIIRISGSLALSVGEKLTKKKLKPRFAHLVKIFDKEDIIDECIIIYFPSPASFTGEDIIEIQAHGNAFLLNRILNLVFTFGVRQSKPGEFLERAFFNNKIDLAQAEAIADIINASSEQAATSALKSMQGVFSNFIHDLINKITELRIYIEAAIDFPEDEIDFLSNDLVEKKINIIKNLFSYINNKARQGSILSEGMTIVLAGRPNAGKSSLLNALSGKESAIVTDIAGTTRDVLKETIAIDGMPLHIIDTAGIHESKDPIEMAGIKKAWSEIEKADLILFLSDSTITDEYSLENIWPEFYEKIPDNKKIVVVRNKADLSGLKTGLIGKDSQTPVITLSVKNNDGINLLCSFLKEFMGYESTSENIFSARRRHLEAISKASDCFNKGLNQLKNNGAGELFAEDLRQTQHHLGTITGHILPDDLLGKIFNSFCIGK